MNAETALHEHLNSLNYSIDARPVLNSSAPIVVWMVMRIFKLIDFSSEERLSVMATLTTSWVDEFMTWNPADYGGLTVIYRRMDTIWKCTPFTLWNSASTNVFYTLNGSHPIVLQYDGRTAMDLTTVFTVVCEMDVSYFPWDTQQCQIQIKPTLMNTDHMIFMPVPGMNLIASADPSNSEWMIQTSSVVQYVSVVNALSGLYFSTSQPIGYINVTVYYLNMTLSRMPGFYVYNIIAPVCIISSLSLLSYFIPGNSGDRIGLTVSVFLSFSVFQSYVNNFIPRSATVPMLTSYIVLQMALSAVCILSGVVTLLLHDMKSAMPPWLRAVVVVSAKCLFVRQPHDLKHEAASKRARDQLTNDVDTQIRNIVKRKSSADYVTSLDTSEVRTASEGSSINLSKITDGAVATSSADNVVKSAVTITTEPAIAKKKKCSRSYWVVLNDVLNRLVLVICFTVIVSLTTYFLVTIETEGPEQ